jgi:Zn-dependent protease
VTTDFSIGRVRVRLEVVPIILGIAVIVHWEIALAFLVAVVLHEAAHWGVARALGGPSQSLILQVTGGGSYIRAIESTKKRIAVLAAGPMASGAATLLALLAAIFGGPSIGKHASFFFYANAVWTMYQLTPFPPLDGGQILRVLLAPRFTSATTAWRVGWAAGFVVAGAWVLVDLSYAQPVILLVAMALILGRGEAGYVRHLDAYAAWEKGDHAKVIRLVKKVPDSIDRNDRRTVLELGVFSAMELEDAAALEEITRQLPAHRPVVMKAAEWLLQRDNPYGAKLAQHALDALDQELTKPMPDELEAFADLLFRYAVYEARAFHPDSALGLLERAIDLGFRDADRLRADADLTAVESHPRYRTLVLRIGQDA